MGCLKHKFSNCIFISQEANLVEEMEDSPDFWSGPVQSYNSPVEHRFLIGLDRSINSLLPDRDHKYVSVRTMPPGMLMSFMHKGISRIYKFIIFWQGTWIWATWKTHQSAMDNYMMFSSTAYLFNPSFVLREKARFFLCVCLNIIINPPRVLAQNRHSILNVHRNLID